MHLLCSPSFCVVCNIFSLLLPIVPAKNANASHVNASTYASQRNKFFNSMPQCPPGKMESFRIQLLCLISFVTKRQKRVVKHAKDIEIHAKLTMHEELLDALYASIGYSKQSSKHDVPMIFPQASTLHIFNVVTLS